MKDNKLIAEFMGLENPFNEITDATLYRYKGVNEKGDVRVEDLQYNESWDWLMPVVEKIYQLDSNADFFGSINLEATYKEVVGFIKTYNDER